MIRTTDDLGEHLAACSCCGLPRIRRRERDSDDHRPERCGPCGAHADINLQKLKEHRDWWIEHRQLMLAEIEKERSKTAHIVKVAEDLGTALEDLRRGVIADVDSEVDHPLHVYLERAAVVEAKEQVHAAYRTRDQALRTVWHLEEAHHDDRNGRCSCGAALTSCREYQMLLPILPTLQRWEQQQEKRLSEGKPHGLPADHAKGSRRSATTHWEGAPSLRDEISYASQR